MKKLETLTPEQEAYIPVLRKKWEDVFYKNESLDRENVEKYIGWLYKRYLKKEPHHLGNEGRLSGELSNGLQSLCEDVRKEQGLTQPNKTTSENEN